MPSELIVIQNTKSILPYTPHAAMVSVPKLFMQLWMIMLLTLYIALCAAAGMPMVQTAPKILAFSRILSSARCQGIPSEPATQRSVSSALATWLATVAMAAPATPQPSTAMNTTSSTILTSDAAIKKYSGRLESPMARRI